MTHAKFLILFLSVLLFGCGANSNPARMFSIQLDEKGKDFKQNALVGVRIKSKKDTGPFQVSYSMDGKPLELTDNQLKLAVDKLGNKTLVAHLEYEGEKIELTKKIRVLADIAPELYTYEIVNEYPHDMQAFTQGLEFEGDTLYEGTGKNGKSSLRKVDFRTGEVLAKHDLDYNYFGEGITVLNNKIYQLTWRNKTGFIYDQSTLKPQGSFQYGQSSEGWGLCNDGKQLYKSDGTERIWILNPDTLQEVDYLEIVTDKSVFNKANELEYVDGRIYANVWQKESMMIINANSGAIEGVVNFSGLKQRVSQHPELDVLNGIAYHSERETFFVTGKNWDKLFEVRIYKK